MPAQPKDDYKKASGESISWDLDLEAERMLLKLSPTKLPFGPVAPFFSLTREARGLCLLAQYLNYRKV